MKISLVCSHGGHLTEILYLMDAFESHEIFFITYDNFRTRELNYNKYLLENIGINPIKMIKAFFYIFRILWDEEPHLIISTGSEIAIPAFILGKLMRKRTIFIESWCRVKNKSTTGKLLYYISDDFFVQWPQLLEVYGNKVKYKGGVL
ncbi:PssD/Cps14F family polysaccharide biosynthesis glycosyltransferase [uncultured Methanobacterium sp.]|uniref:PssD/Cps14F family polysaccharide biosynthesis glycosyltransferase n=1 Tax=uncultured Methanobacterium sp. TaxID=176306 RepID=UPI002AA8C810|nr:PssD/Cps14F family polysaccharide biosynthesis glycosyltransferase [uncultured Methanobacterium sp.]